MRAIFLLMPLWCTWARMVIRGLNGLMLSYQLLPTLKLLELLVYFMLFSEHRGESADVE